MTNTDQKLLQFHTSVVSENERHNKIAIRWRVRMVIGMNIDTFQFQASNEKYPGQLWFRVIKTVISFYNNTNKKYILNIHRAENAP